MSLGKQFNSIYKNQYKQAFRFVMLYVRNEMVAEDIVTESLLKLWETMKIDTVERPVSLLITILKHKSLDYLKTQATAQKAIKAVDEWRVRELKIRISTLNACEPNLIYTKEIQEIITKALQNLPPQTKKVFTLSRFEQKTGKEIAEHLGISVKGVNYHITKALNLLRVLLKDYLPLLFVFLD